MTNGWDESADAWIRDMGDEGDFGRKHVLDKPMLERVRMANAQTALDVGCGEGRFCRMLASQGIRTTGLDPTQRLLEQAMSRDPSGTYIRASASAMPLPDHSFDLTVAYLSLIDIPDLTSAIPEMVRVTKPGGRLLIANLNGFNTAGLEHGWIKSLGGTHKYYAFDRYLEERGVWSEWRGIRIVNHHRPLSTYMKLFLGQGLQLTCFDEPEPGPDAPPDRRERYRRAPWFFIMEWLKPLGA